ncbi:MAG: hypothetical protein ABIK86_07670, partial [candidate division WOR-3 bacterium]
YRFTTKSFATLDLGASRQQTDTTRSSSPANRRSTLTLLPGLGFNLNLLRFLYLQLNLNYSHPLAPTPPRSLALSGRITGQF